MTKAHFEIRPQMTPPAQRSARIDGQEPHKVHLTSLNTVGRPASNGHRRSQGTIPAASRLLHDPNMTLCGVLIASFLSRTPTRTKVKKDATRAIREGVTGNCTAADRTTRSSPALRMIPTSRLEAAARRLAARQCMPSAREGVRVAAKLPQEKIPRYATISFIQNAKLNEKRKSARVAILAHRTW